jgi:putative peptidoglycan lipid II flippase
VNKKPRAAAILVASGIMLSRLSGLIRDRIFAHYFGASDAADAFGAALRIPNFLQNLFGEGVLSASFIPVYAGLLAKDSEEEAGKVAGAVVALLSLVTSVLVLLGVLATPLFIDLIAPGFHGEKRELTISLVRILFPGAGLLVLSAWCLGILNSHRRFFLSYSVSVLWNVAMIAALVGWGASSTQSQLAKVVAWGSVAGRAAQFLVQLPVVLKLVPHLKVRLETGIESVQIILRNFGPVFVSRGVVQLSGYIDSMLASLLGTGAVSSMRYATNISMLPVSLFGMSISASELPEMSREASGEALRTRLLGGLRRIAFLVVPSVVAFVALGDVIAAAIYQSGAFGHPEAVYVWFILAGSGIGLLASTQSRLYSSAFYALKDTRTPLRFAVIRIILTTALGYFFAKPFPAMMGLDARWGAAGLTASAGVSGWVEFALLRNALSKRIGEARVNLAYMARLWGSAMAAAAIAWGIKLKLPPVHPIVAAVAILVPFGGIYLGLAGWRNLSRR